MRKDLLQCRYYLQIMPRLDERSQILGKMRFQSVKIAPSLELRLPTLRSFLRLQSSSIYARYAEAFRKEVQRVLHVLEATSLEGEDELTAEQKNVLDATSQLLGVDLRSGTAEKVEKLYHGKDRHELRNTEGIIDETRRILEAYVDGKLKKKPPKTRKERRKRDIRSGLRTREKYRRVKEKSDSDGEDTTVDLQEPNKNIQLQERLKELKALLSDYEDENRRLSSILEKKENVLFDEKGILYLPGLSPSFCIDFRGIVIAASAEVCDERDPVQGNRFKNHIAHLCRTLLIAIPDPDDCEDRQVDISDWDDGVLIPSQFKKKLSENGVLSMVYPEVVFPQYWVRKTEDSRVYFSVRQDIVDQYHDELLFVRVLFKTVVLLCSQIQFRGRKSQPDFRSPEERRIQERLAQAQIELAGLRGAIEAATEMLTGLKKEAQRTRDTIELAEALIRIEDPDVIRIANALTVNAEPGPREAIQAALRMNGK